MNRECYVKQIKLTRLAIIMWSICGALQLFIGIINILQHNLLFLMNFSTVCLDGWLVWFNSDRLKQSKNDLAEYDHQPKKLIE